MNQQLRVRGKMQKLGVIPWYRIIAITVMVAGTALPTSAQEITFRFQPPDSIVFKRTLTNTRVKEMASAGKQTDVTVGTEQVSIKKTPTGYSMDMTPISASMTRNGTAVDNPLVTLPLDVTVTYEMDADGELLAIRGYDRVIKKMEESFPPEMVKSLASVINEDAMIDKEATEWDARISSFVGQTVKMGDLWTSTDELALPTGQSVVYHTATKFVEKVKCGTHDCVRIQFWYNSDAGALQAFVGKVLNDFADSAGTPQVKEISGAEIVGEGERIIDPTTMLIYAESISRTVTMQMDVPGKGKVTVTGRETREIIFDYNK